MLLIEIKFISYFLSEVAVILRTCKSDDMYRVYYVYMFNILSKILQMIYRLLNNNNIPGNIQEQEYILISVVPCGPAVGGSLSTQYTDRLLIKHIK